MRSVLKTARLGLFTLAAVLGITGTSEAAYDIDTRGVPKFVNVNYIELAKITRLSKFRSMAGHNYSDNSQFGPNGYKDSTNRIEQCTSMKHYFIAPDATVKIVSPVAGSVSTIRVGPLGSTVEIQPDSQPDFSIGIFHVELTTPLAIGQHVSEGQPLGHHTGTETWSDVSVWVQTPRGKHLISYFEVLTDEAFAPFQARGLATRDTVIRSKAERAAMSNVCSFTGEPTEFVDLTGSVATQTVSVQTVLNPTMRIGDAPVAISGTASSGLPVEVVSATPKVCAVTNSAVTPRRPGACRVLVTQPGNDAVYEARAVTLRTLILPADAPDTARPRLGLVFPPGGGPQSYLRFFNTGSVAGTVTASLINGGTGETVAKWQSPSIPPGAAPQFSVSALEAAATAPIARPGYYSVQIEPETNINGYMQHVLFDAGVESITNASTCDTGVMSDPYRMMNVHSSLFDFGYPSTAYLYNIGLTNVSMGLQLRDSSDGRSVGWFFSGRLPPPTKVSTLPSQLMVINEALMETVIAPQLGSSAVVNIAPPSSYQFNMTDETAIINAANNPISKYIYQHLIASKRPGAVTDMSTVCALNGRSTATANALLQATAFFSTLQATGQSLLRFYNSGTTPGPVNLTLYGNYEDQPLGTWTSTDIPAGAELEVPIATIERELKLHRNDVYIPTELVKQDTYSISVATNIDGFFQHALRRDPGGALTNLSACYEATTTAGKTLMTVNSSVMDASGYTSIVVVSNTGAVASPTTLGIYDSRSGALLGSMQTDPVSAHGLLRLDVAAIEAAAGVVPDANTKYYVVKTQDAFTGFLQHIVYSKTTGVLADMTAVCMM